MLKLNPSLLDLPGGQPWRFLQFRFLPRRRHDARHYCFERGERFARAIFISRIFCSFSFDDDSSKAPLLENKISQKRRKNLSSSRTTVRMYWWFLHNNKQKRHARWILKLLSTLSFSLVKRVLRRDLFDHLPN